MVNHNNIQTVLLEIITFFLVLFHFFTEWNIINFMVVLGIFSIYIYKIYIYEIYFVKNNKKLNKNKN